MEEEKINELFEVEDKNSNETIIKNMVNNIESDAASKGLIKASNISRFFMGLGIAIIVIGVFVFIVSLDSYGSKSEIFAITGISCVFYGVLNVIFFYIISKILIGLSVMTKASETYLKDKS